MTVIFGILESSATQCYHAYQDVAPTQEFFSFIVTSIVYAYAYVLEISPTVDLRPGYGRIFKYCEWRYAQVVRYAWQIRSAH
jgi:hypothetical protein